MLSFHFVKSITPSYKSLDMSLRKVGSSVAKSTGAVLAVMPFLIPLITINPGSLGQSGTSPSCGCSFCRNEIIILHSLHLVVMEHVICFISIAVPFLLLCVDLS